MRPHLQPRRCYAALLAQHDEWQRGHPRNQAAWHARAYALHAGMSRLQASPEQVPIFLQTLLQCGDGEGHEGGASFVEADHLEVNARSCAGRVDTGRWEGRDALAACITCLFVQAFCDAIKDEVWTNPIKYYRAWELEEAEGEDVAEVHQEAGA